MIDACSEQLKKSDLRQTETRRVLIELLHQASGPLAPPEIVALCHQAGRQANKTTVYRDLAAMEQAGIIRKVIVSDRKQYFELTERGHHHHLICLDCDRIQDVEIEDSRLLRQARQLSEQLKFRIQEHTVEFYGLCKVCQGAK
jgi:Fur family ferric uptake transcriptional regulator